MSDEKEDDEKQILRLLNFASDSSKQNDQCCDCGLFPLELEKTFVVTPRTYFFIANSHLFNSLEFFILH